MPTGKIGKNFRAYGTWAYLYDLTGTQNHIWEQSTTLHQS